MVVRRNDSRRRRNMVAEPTDASGDVPNASTSREKKKSKRDASLYAYGANRRSQLKTTDLIPKRVFAVSVLVVGVIVVFGLLNVLAIFAPRWEPHIGTHGVDALALSGTGTLSAWFCSMLLGVAGLVCLQLFRLRKHRRDDYHGSYRMWLLMSVACFIGSIETATHLFTIVWPLTESLTKISIQQTAWLPLAIGVPILSLLIARTAFEIRESRAALTLIVTAWLALVAAGVFQLPVAQPVADQLGGELLLGNCFLLGVVGVFMATVIDARFVFLQAHGLIKPNLNATKRKLAKAEKAAAKKAAVAAAKLKRETDQQAAHDAKVAAKAASQAASRDAKAAKVAEKSDAKASAKEKAKAKAKVGAKEKADAKTANQAKAKAAIRISDDSTTETGTSQKSKTGFGKKPKSKPDSSAPMKSKIKPASKSATSEDIDSTDDGEEHEGILNMSKAQQRRQRKQEQRQQKSSRRAA